MKKLLLKLSKNTFIQGGLFLTASNLIIGLINYAFNFLAGRALGPEGYGEIAALFSYIVILSIPISVIGMLLIQKIGESEDSYGYALAAQEWILLQARKWWFLIVLILATTPFIPMLTNLTPVAGYSLPLLFIISLLGAFYSGALQGLHLFVWFSIISIITAVIKLSGAAFAMFGFGELEFVLLMIILSGVISIIFSGWVFRRHVHSKVVKINLMEKRIRDIFKDRQLWYTAGVTGVLTILNNIDIIYVKKNFPADEAGIFGAWSLFAKMILYGIGPLLTLSFIFFSSKKNEKYHQLVFILSFILFVFVGVATNLGYGAFGRLMIESLFGSKFFSLYPYVEWASLFGIGYVMMMFMMNYFLARKSAISLIPVFLFPGYLIALFVFGDQLVDVMYIDTLFTFICVTIFLTIFFKNRLVHLIYLFKKH